MPCFYCGLGVFPGVVGKLWVSKSLCIPFCSKCMPIHSNLLKMAKYHFYLLETEDD